MDAINPGLFTNGISPALRNCPVTASLGTFIAIRKLDHVLVLILGLSKELTQIQRPPLYQLPAAAAAFYLSSVEHMSPWDCLNRNPG